MKSLIFILLLVIPLTAANAEQVYKTEELEQMIAPIALYPDALLAQVLTAATYPLEVVEAARFVNEHQGLSGEALFEAAGDEDWEPSVKALLAFPDLLTMMDEQLEWTKGLGEAFLVQQAECMDAVQRLRQKAYDQGNLVSTEKQVIKVEPQTKIIIIEPVNPEIVYVPVYDTAIIYGTWWYPGYPPYYFYSRRYSGITFFSGIYVGPFWGVWGTWDFNWPRRHVYVNVTHYNTFTRKHYIRGRHYQFYGDGAHRQPWKHDFRHRGRVRSERQRSGLTDRERPRAPEIRRHERVSVRAPAIRVKEEVRPTVRASRSEARPDSRREVRKNVRHERREQNREQMREHRRGPEREQMREYRRSPEKEQMREHKRGPEREQIREHRERNRTDKRPDMSYYLHHERAVSAPAGITPGH